MKNERILNALSKADDRYVEEAAPVKARSENALAGDTAQSASVTVAAKRRSFGGWAAAAACLCAAVGGLVLWSAFGGNSLTEGGSTQDTGQSQDVDLTDGDTAPTDLIPATLYLSQEELYGCDWTMFLPRWLPEGYRIVESTRFDATGLLDEGTIYMRITDGKNPISYTVYADRSVYDELLGSTELFIRDIGIDDMPLLKESGLIDCDNTVVMIKVDIAEPDLISDEELYRFIMSVPFADNFAACGIETIDLSAQIGTYLPTVAIGEFFDVQRLTVSKELMAEHGGIWYYDGRYIYFNDTEYDLALNGLGQLRRGNFVLTRYDTETGKQVQWTLGDRDYVDIFHSDDDYIYCEAFAPTENVSTDYETGITSYDYGIVYLTKIDIATGEETVIATSEGTFIWEPVVNDGVIYRDVTLYNENHKASGYEIIRYDTKTGVLTTISSIDKGIADDPGRLYDTIDYMTPYKDGVLFRMEVSEDYYCWDGSADSKAELLIVTDLEYNDDGTVKRLPEIYSDGEILYFAKTGIHYTGDIGEEKQDFIVLGLWSEMSGRIVHAVNNAASDEKDIYSWIHREIGRYSADGMILLNSSSGVIYDALNGVFTCPDPDMYYELFDTVGDSLILVEADSRDKASALNEPLEETVDDVILCIITRK